MPRPKKVSDDQIRVAYWETGSVHKAAQLVGIHAASLHERLVRMGDGKRQNYFTDADIDRLRRDYVGARDSGRLPDLAKDMARTVPFLSRKARTLGLTDSRHKRPGGRWKLLTEEAARVLFERFRNSSLALRLFCRNEGLPMSGFVRTMKAFWPDEWDLVVEVRQPRGTKYSLGRAFEYQCRDHLRRLGYFVLRSPASKGLVDLVAMKTGRVLFIQCKRGGSIGVKEWNDFLTLSTSVGATPLLACKSSARRKAYYEMTGRKDGSKRPQPMREYQP